MGAKRNIFRGILYPITDNLYILNWKSIKHSYRNPNEF
jgi:hypothetical protein